MRIFTLLFVLYGLAHVYLFICLRRMIGGGIWQLLALCWCAVMVSAWYLRHSGLPQKYMTTIQDINFFWMGLLILLCYGFLAADLGCSLLRLAAKLTHSNILASILAHPRRILLAGCTLGLLLWAWSLYAAQNPIITRLTLSTPKLPAGNAPLKIIGLSDIHLGPFIGAQMLERLQGMIAKEQADIILMAGDIVDTNMAKRTKDAEIIASFPARLGVFAVTGNHERYQGVKQSLQFLKKAKVRVLRGESAEIGGISLGGVDDNNFFDISPETTNMKLLLNSGKVKAAHKNKFTLIMNHKPRVESAHIGRFDLQFSGHTHGGQFWPGNIIVSRIFGFEQGLTRLSRVKSGQEKSRSKNTASIQKQYLSLDNAKATQRIESVSGTSLLYISNGIGFWGPPVRLYARPEVLVLTLVPQQK